MQHAQFVCGQQGVGMAELTGAVAMDGILCRVNRAITQCRYVSTKPAVVGRLRQALQVPQPKVCLRRGEHWYFFFLSEMTHGYLGLITSNKQALYQRVLKKSLWMPDVWFRESCVMEDNTFRIVS